ncbi:MAG TPA: sensor histidine kinase [Gaiellaceae bacterium]|nr:sensor histidine kinase [Gaiellaceae bacterium]
MRIRLFTLAFAGIAAALTATASLAPGVTLAYRSPQLHVAIDTATALISFLVAYLVFGRFRERKRLDDLVLACALALIATSSFVFSALPHTVPAEGTRNFSVWASVGGAVLGAFTLALAAFIPSTRIARTRRATVIAALSCAGALIATASIVALFANGVDPEIPVGISPSDAHRPILLGQHFLLGTQIVGVLLFLAAALGFIQRGERDRDELMRWFAAGAALSAFARFNFFLFPSLYSDWVFTGDFLRLGFCLLLLAGAAREIGSYWRRLASMAVLEERRRIARELHDGVAQELAYIVAESTGSLAAAAERALDESRRAIAALTRAVDEPLEVALVQAAEEVAGRVGVQLRVDVCEGAKVTPDEREALIRIVREAITNAGRHGGATSVSVELTNGHGTLLRIADDGSGFDPRRTRVGGFGLVSMRERAEALGGRFTLCSEDAGGTKIEVRLP